MTTTPTVELQVSGSWTDITSYVMVRDGSNNITINRGQPNEGSRTEASRCSFQLNNRDGRFSPRNPLGPLYGLIGRNQPVRVSVPSGGGSSVRWLGEIPAWPQKWDTTGADVWVELEGAGVLRRLGQGNQPLGSAMYVALAGGQSLNTVIAYWPLEDPSGSTVLSSAVSGVRPMTIVGAPTLATNSDFVCSLPLPKLGTASFTGTISPYVPIGGSSSTNPFNTLLRFLLEIPAGGATDGQVVAAMTWSGTTIPRWEIYYAAASSGRLGLRGRDSMGAIVQDTGTGGPALNGVPVHVTASWDEAGGILLEFGLSILPVGSTSPSGPTGSVAGPIPGVVQSVTIAPGRGLPDTVVGHVSVQLTPSYPTDAAPLALAAAGYAGEPAADRIARLCAIAGVGYETLGTVTTTALMGVQTSSTILNLIQQAVDADGGRLTESLTMIGLGYRSRIALENQAATLALSYTAYQLAAVPTPLDDDQYTRNDITVTRQGGSFARATLTAGALSTAAPPAGVGPYPDAVTLSLQSDADTTDQAGWRLHLGTVDEARYPQLSVNLAHPSMAALRSTALGVRIGDRVTVANPPAWLPPDTISQLVLGTSETIDQFQHRITFNCQPESPYRVAVTDDATFGRADTDGCVLASAVTSGATTLGVVTTTRGPLWVTTAANPAEFPFAVRASGELMTVTAAASPVTDAFSRTVSNSWGTADSGQAWTATGGSAANYEVTGGVGHHLASSVNVFRLTTLPLLNAAFDVRTQFTTLAAPTGDSQWVYLVARYVDPANMYLARVQIAPTTGAMTLNIRKRTTAAGDVAISDFYVTGLTYVAGDMYWVRFSGIGSDLRAKLWHTGVQEPDWQTAAYDSDLAAAGATGVRTLLGASSTNTLPVTFAFDNFQVINYQTMTVTRSVNGVVKAQSAGTDIRLDQPATTAL